MGCHNGKRIPDHVMYWVAGYTYSERYRYALYYAMAAKGSAAHGTLLATV